MAYSEVHFEFLQKKGVLELQFLFFTHACEFTGLVETRVTHPTGEQEETKLLQPPISSQALFSTW